MLKGEKESVFRWDSEEKVVHIFSCHPRVWRRLERKGHMPIKNNIREGREVTRQYRIPLATFRFGFRAVDQPRRLAPTGAFKPKKHAKTTRNRPTG